MATFDEFYESLPGDSNKRGEYFEKVFVPWFLKTDPEWSTQVKEVWLWDDYPHRWGKDCGIDLVYEDTQGKHWAVQSKCVSPDREISKAEIDSFLSESSDPVDPEPLSVDLQTSAEAPQAGSLSGFHPCV